jgi:hypothetical protein
MMQQCVAGGGSRGRALAHYDPSHHLEKHALVSHRWHAACIRLHTRVRDWCGNTPSLETGRATGKS